MTASVALKGLLRKMGLVVIRERNAGARFIADPPATALDHALLRAFPRLDGLRFLQIGANDGVRADPIRDKVIRHGWTGVLVEPVPTLFAQLKANYSGRPGLLFVNAAIDRADGRLPIYKLRPDLAGLPDWSWGLCSLDRARVEKAAAELGLGEDAIEQESVETMSWGRLLAAFGREPCDLLVVDTEGRDIGLLWGAPLETWKPRVIQFEHACNAWDERMGIYQHLLSLGYEIASDGGDTVAWRPTA